MKDVERPRGYTFTKNTAIKKLMAENPKLSLAEASSIYMAQLREIQARKRELLKDFAPHKHKEPYDKMLATRKVREEDKKKRLLADMDIIERADYKRRQRKGLLPLRDQVTLPLNTNGHIPAHKVLNGIPEDQKPASIKQAFVDVFNDLQAEEPYSLKAWAKMNPSQFYLLITKLLPNPNTTDEKPITIKSITFE